MRLLGDGVELLEALEFEFLPTTNGIGKARRTTLNGREYIVAPITSIVPGILNGSKGALYYPPDEIGANPEAWNGVPLTVYHPTRNGYHVSARDPEILESQGIGTVYGSTFNGALRHEGWFDVELTQKADKKFGTDILPRLLANQPIEMSTGLFTDNEPAQNGATHKGRPYDAIARNYKPDHIAILPGEVGACSVNDGCGVMVNQADDKKCGDGKWGTRGAAVAANDATANHIVKLKGGKYRLLSHEGKNLGTFDSHEAAAKHEGEVEYFKRADNCDEGMQHNRLTEMLAELVENAEQEADEECECGGTCDECKMRMKANALAANTWSDAAREAAAEARRAAKTVRLADKVVKRHTNFARDASLSAERKSETAATRLEHENASGAHKDAARMHSSAAVTQEHGGNQEGAEAHRKASELHKQAAELHIQKAVTMNQVVANLATPAECFVTLLHAATAAHILHLQTRSFAAHSALDGLYKELPGLVDDLIEAWQGIHGIVQTYPAGFKVPPSEPVEFVKSLSDYLKDNRAALGSETEIQNIVDEIAGMLDGTAYKLRFLS